MKNKIFLKRLKLRSSKSGSDRPLRATWTKTAAPTWIAAQLRYGSCSSLNEASFSHLYRKSCKKIKFHMLIDVNRTVLQCNCYREPETVFIPQMFVPENGQSWQRVGCLHFQASLHVLYFNMKNFHQLCISM